MSDYLSTSEAGRLAELEIVIERGLQTFIEVGSALMEIRNSRLYRQMYATFEEYCQERWDLRKSRTYQLMDAAEVVENLKSSTIVELSTGNVPLPVNEAQARPLAKLGFEMQRQAWQKAVETAPQGRITARHVETIVRELQAAQVEQRRAGQRVDQQIEVARGEVGAVQHRAEYARVCRAKTANRFTDGTSLQIKRDGRSHAARSLSNFSETVVGRS